jgi:uncharacterized protein with von Willebrand factor type A (vWA) domain
VRWLLSEVTAKGTTDIMNPLYGALKLVNEATGCIPCIYIITDGCVENERDVCETVEMKLQVRRLRIMLSH